MSDVKRIRWFTGPNGSGKTSLYNEFSKKYGKGLFINADDITQILRIKTVINLSDFGIESGQMYWQEFLKSSHAKSLIGKAEKSGETIDLTVKENCIINPFKRTNSYEGAYLAAFLRYSLIELGISFAAESVFSHPSRLIEMEKAEHAGFRNYLYFVCTDSSEINISRVSNRVKKGGHNVPENKVRERYSRVLGNLGKAIQIAYRAYLFDNSGENMILIAEYSRGQLVESQNLNVVPNWVRDFQT